MLRDALGAQRKGRPPAFERLEKGGWRDVSKDFPKELTLQETLRIDGH